MSKRKERKDRTEVQIWLVRNNIKRVDIQKALGLKYLTQVSETIQGDRDDRRVLKWLRDNGCPDNYLNLPEELEINR